MGVQNHLNICGSAGVFRPRSSANKVKPGQNLSLVSLVLLE